MEEEREQVIRHILAIDKRLYEYLQWVRMPDWAGLELTMPQLKVLFLASGPRPLSTSHVARSLGMTLSTATGVVDRLVAQGLVLRREDPADRRVVLVRATPRGSALMERLLSTGLGYFREILDRLSLEELRVVARALDLLHNTAMSLESGQQSAVSYQPSADSYQLSVATGQPSTPGDQAVTDLRSPSQGRFDPQQPDPTHSPVERTSSMSADGRASDRLKAEG